MEACAKVTDVGLWIDPQGQYQARAWFYGVEVCGHGWTPVEAFAACWAGWVQRWEGGYVSVDSRPQREDVSEAPERPC